MTTTTLASIVARLNDADVEVRESAAEELDALSRRGLSLEEGLAALRAATKKYRPRERAWNDSSADLISAAAGAPRPEYAPVVLEIYAALTSDDARLAALRLLAASEGRESALALMQIIRSGATTGQLPDLDSVWAGWGPTAELRYPEIFFPELLEYAAERQSYGIYRRCLGFCYGGLLTPASLARFADQIAADSRRLRNVLLPRQEGEPGPWCWEDDDYVELRARAALVLDLLGFCPTRGAAEEVRSSLAYRDPWPLCYAVTSSLRLDGHVDRRYVSAVAAWPETRMILFDYLQGIGRLALMPRQFRAQGSLAEAELVRWLSYPGELGHPPEAIELMDVFSVDTDGDDGPLDLYVFRFLSEDRWYAGVSGPYLRRDAPSTLSYGLTFSAFEDWDSMTPEEHVGSIDEILAAWREHHFGEQTD